MNMGDQPGPSLGGRPAQPGLVASSRARRLGKGSAGALKSPALLLCAGSSVQKKLFSVYPA